MSEYTIQARKFLAENNIKFSVSYVGENQPNWDDQYHSEYLVRFYNRNTRKSMSVHFFQSLHNAGQEPTAYDVLTCLQKYDVGTIDDFVAEFGYEVNSWKDVKRIEKTYKAVRREYNNVVRVFNDCMDALQEIS